MTYSEVLQTVSTLTGVAGFVYIAFIARRLHGAVNQQTEDLKQSIGEHTKALVKNGVEKSA